MDSVKAAERSQKLLPGASTFWGIATIIDHPIFENCCAQD
jgi:hypothetical protein